jgi:hypothetical protein
VGYGRISKAAEINMSQQAYKVSGVIRSNSSPPFPLERVRVVVSPGIVAEGFRTTTDADGKYTIANVPSGSQVFMFMVDGYQVKAETYDISADTTLDNYLDYIPDQWASLSGTVTATYQGVDLPLPHAEIRLGGGAARAFTDQNGSYSFPVLPPGLYSGIVQKAGYKPKQLGGIGFTELRNGANTRNYQLSFDGPGPVVSGDIVHPVTQTPIEGVEISVLTSWDKKRAKASSGVLTDATGHFTLLDMPHGLREFLVKIPGADPYTVAVNITGSVQLPQISNPLDNSSTVGSLAVAILPAGAVTAGAKWSLDGGTTWKDSGTTITSVAAGNAMVTFNDLDGWIRPTDQSVTIVAGQTATVTGTYTEAAQTGSLTVMIEPAAAVTAGAAWSIDGGANWMDSGTTLTGIAVGYTMVTFKDVTGWTKPTDQTVAITAVQTATATGTYIESSQTGSLTVMIQPSGAVTAGAKWSIDGGANWKGSGTTLAGITAGNATVTFKDVAGWAKPGDQTVAITAGGAAGLTGTYILSSQTGSLTVTIEPAGVVAAGAKWSVDGGANWKDGGSTLAGIAAGNRIVTFKDVLGWTKPADQTVAITAGGAAGLTGTYILSSETGSLTVTIQPAGAVTAGAKWSIDGGANWKFSGTTLAGIAVGSVTVTFKDVIGWTKPASQMATITAEETATATGTYTQEAQTGSLTVTIHPETAVTAGAKWNVDGGASQSGGATVSGLSVGAHTVSFTSVSGWTTPGSQSVTIIAGQTATVTGTYIQAAQTGSLTVMIEPAGAVAAGAKWSIDGGVNWNDGSTTLVGVAVGSATLTFKDVTGWSTPVSQSVTIVSGAMSTATGTYTQTVAQYTLSTSVVGGHGSLAPSTGVQDANAVVTLTATPDNGYRVKTWTGTDDDTGVTNTNAVTMTGNRTVSVEFELIPQTVSVPNVVGRTQIAAQMTLTSVGLTLGTVSQRSSGTVPMGQVISQNPAAGASVASGSVVNLVLSKGALPVTVPNLVGLERSAAETAITNLGLTVGSVAEEFNADIAAGQVISQDPASDTTVAPGSAVSMVISKGSQKAGIFGCNGQIGRETPGNGRSADLLTLLLACALLAGSRRSRSVTDS